MLFKLSLLFSLFYPRVLSLKRIGERRKGGEISVTNIAIDVFLFGENELDMATLRGLCKPDENFLDFIIFYLKKRNLIFFVQLCKMAFWLMFSGVDKCDSKKLLIVQCLWLGGYLKAAILM